VSIRSLSLRVPGSDAAAGRRITASVAESMARALPGGLTRNIDSIHLRVQASASQSEAAVSDAIVSALVRAVSRRQ
jgi:hypothetical protein